MEDLDQRLKHLAKEAQHYFGTARGQTLLMQLWHEVYCSGRLYRPLKDKIPGVYEDIYDEAILQLMEYTLRNISVYDAQKASIIGWMNMLLERRFIREAIQRFTDREQKFQRPTLADLDEEGSSSNDHDIEAIPVSKPKPSPSELIQQCLREDEGDRFKQTCIPRYPSVNFQQVALLHHVEGYSFKEIAERLQVPYTSLVSFYQRRLKQFTPIIRAYCLH
jgi:DNA-directed RNA polymerase specialized sigma24 family protein